MKQTFAVKDQAILEVAEQVLDQIKAAGADQGETWVSRNVLTELYYELGKISMIRTVFSDNINLKLLKDKRKGTVSLNSFDHVDIQRAVQEAWQASQSAVPDEAEGISDQEGTFSFSQGDQQPDLDSMVKQLEDLLQDVKEQFPRIRFESIGIEHRYSERLYANSDGVRLSNAQGIYQLSNVFMANENDKTSSFNYFGSAYLHPIDRVSEAPRVQRIFAETDRQIITTQFDGSFNGDLIITPACLQELLGEIVANYLSDGALIAGTSPWKDKLGEQVASPRFTLNLIAEHSELPAASRISGDGYLTENMPLIEEGILKNFSLTRYGAAKTGLKRSANSGLTMQVESGQDLLEEMISKVKKGILLGRFSGGSPSPAGDFSGVAKNSFLIEDGKITDALSEVMIAGNLGDMLKNIQAVSREYETSGYYSMPWIHVGGITISGK